LYVLQRVRGCSACEALGAVLAGSERLLIVTFGTGLGNLTTGQLAIEENAPTSLIPRVASEEAAASVAARGVRVALVRLRGVMSGTTRRFLQPITLE
jgi:hypothetical protein